MLLLLLLLFVQWFLYSFVLLLLVYIKFYCGFFLQIVDDWLTVRPDRQPDSLANMIVCCACMFVFKVGGSSTQLILLLRKFMRVCGGFWNTLWFQFYFVVWFNFFSSVFVIKKNEKISSNCCKKKYKKINLKIMVREFMFNRKRFVFFCVLITVSSRF